MSILVSIAVVIGALIIAQQASAAPVGPAIGRALVLSSSSPAQSCMPAAGVLPN